MTKNNKNTFVTKSARRVAPEYVDHVAGLVNPFADSAKGSKIHDENSGKTFPFQVRAITPILVNEHGAGYTEFYPSLHEYVSGIGPTATNMSASGILGTSASFSLEDVPDYTSLTQVGMRYRIVSWGVRLISTTDALSAKGRVLIREMDSYQAYASSPGQDVTVLTDNYANVPHTHDMDFTIIPNHVSDKYKQFQAFATSYYDMNSDTANDPPFRAVALTLTGFTAAGSGAQIEALQAEVVYNIEVLPLVATIGMRLATDPAPHHNPTLEAVHNTRASAPLVNKTPSLWQRIKGIATKAINTAGNFALDRLTGGLSSYIRTKAPMLTYIPNMSRGSVPLLTNG
jgi:hypothetical protein